MVQFIKNLCWLCYLFDKMVKVSDNDNDYIKVIIICIYGFRFL